jgi:hypothetical protein
VGFEPTISAGERPQTYALDRAATGTGNETYRRTKICYIYRLMNKHRKKTAVYKTLYHREVTLEIWLAVHRLLTPT